MCQLQRHIGQLNREDIKRQEPLNFWVTGSNLMQWQIPQNYYLVIHLKRNSGLSLIPRDQFQQRA